MRYLKTLSLIGLLAFTAFLALNIATESYARPSFGDECLDCHQSGITVTTNATSSIEVEPAATFWLEVVAEGGAPRDTMLVWSNISHNSQFDIQPREVEDNDRNDQQTDGGSITTIFEITAPDVEGNYAIQPNAASARALGGGAQVEVIVGAGGEVPTPLIDIIMGFFTTVVPQTLVGIAILLIVLYFASWRRIEGVTH